MQTDKSAEWADLLVYNMGPGYVPGYERGVEALHSALGYQMGPNVGRSQTAVMNCCYCLLLVFMAGAVAVAGIVMAAGTAPLRPQLSAFFGGKL